MNLDSFERTGIGDYAQSLLLDRDAGTTPESDLRGRVKLLSDLAGWGQMWYDQADEPELEPIHYRALRQTTYQPGFTDALGFVTPTSSTSIRTEYRRYFKFQNPAFAVNTTSPGLDSGDTSSEEFTRGSAIERFRYRILDQSRTLFRVASVGWSSQLSSEPVGFVKPGTITTWELQEPQDLNDWVEELSGKILPLAFPTSSPFIFENSFAGGLQPNQGAEDIPGSAGYGLHPTAGNAVLLSTLPIEPLSDVFGPSDGAFLEGQFPPDFHTGRGGELNVNPGSQVDKTGIAFNDRDVDGGIVTDTNPIAMFVRFRHHRFVLIKIRGLNLRTQRVIVLHKRHGFEAPDTVVSEELSCSRQTGARQNEFFNIGGRFVQVDVPGLSFDRQIYSGEFWDWPRSLSWTSDIISPSILSPTGWQTFPPEVPPFGSTC